MAEQNDRVDETSVNSTMIDFKAKLKSQGLKMKKVLDELDFDSNANIQISTFSKVLKSHSNLKTEEIKRVIQAFNQKNRTHVTGKDVFGIIDKYCPDEDSVGLECKYILARAALEKMQTQEYLETRLNLEIKTPYLSKTIFDAMCRDHFQFPDSSC